MMCLLHRVRDLSVQRSRTRKILNSLRLLAPPTPSLFFPLPVPAYMQPPLFPGAPLALFFIQTGSYHFPRFHPRPLPSIPPFTASSPPPPRATVVCFFLFVGFAFCEVCLFFPDFSVFADYPGQRFRVEAAKVGKLRSLRVLEPLEHQVTDAGLKELKEFQRLGILAPSETPKLQTRPKKEA